ncbi:MAG: phosphate signaling complex protein PhoU [Actinomycetales bacterium]|nr:phosphate signaling complex protein PhoU [Actinomycetales bacterium]
MRNAFQEELDSIHDTLVKMGKLVEESMSEATKALLQPNLEIAEKVIKNDDVIDDMQHELDARTMMIIARQSPVAGDLRTLVTSLRMSADLERMGDMAHHIAKLARMRFPSSAVPNEIKEIINNMDRVAVSIIKKTTQSIDTRNTTLALELERDDDEMDKLHRQLFKVLMDDSWAHGTEVAIDMTLLGRYYERCADHAVSVGRRVYYMVNGEYNS